MTEMAQPSTSGKSLSLNERLALIGLIDEGMRQGSAESPVMLDLFSNLWDLVNATVRGSKIDRLKPQAGRNVFQVLEITGDRGENLGRLNMLYLKKNIPCYYLVYVEVAPPFRKKGLGHRVLTYFRDFLEQKSAMGLLDNIIPKDDPTYDIYLKNGWQPVEKYLPGNGYADYMLYLPDRLKKHTKIDWEEALPKLLHHLKRKRPAIDMRDNEMMVRQTIAEFRELYGALTTYFHREIDTGRPTEIMRFMFTRFVTKLISFRRRISELVGYTGGDSLEQIVLHPMVAALEVQSYPPRGLASMAFAVEGDGSLWLRLPMELKDRPARCIENLPDYRRPSLIFWQKQHKRSRKAPLTIGDLMDLGFDPTRLKEINLDGEEFIFERIQARQLEELSIKKETMLNLENDLAAVRVRKAALAFNPPLLTIKDRGNAYVLRRKVQGIHWEEALEELQTSDRLRKLNQAMKMDSLILATMRQARRKIADCLQPPDKELAEGFSFFIPWDLDTNQPKVMADYTGTYLEKLWLA